MATVTHAYAVQQNVFYVTAVNSLTGINGVNEAVVRSINITITQAGPTITYDIAFSNAVLGSATVAESTLYGDVDSALAAYKILVLQY